MIFVHQTHIHNNTQCSNCIDNFGGQHVLLNKGHIHLITSGATTLKTLAGGVYISSFLILMSKIVTTVSGGFCSHETVLLTVSLLKQMLKWAT